MSHEDATSQHLGLHRREHCVPVSVPLQSQNPALAFAETGATVFQCCNDGGFAIVCSMVQMVTPSKQTVSLASIGFADAVRYTGR
eukprot:m.234367 g.234367  ORF g.234367 m.234367 type:complete len:85 (+) comp18915_c0_seq13:2202-2456(+)